MAYSLNRVQLIGAIGRDPEIRTLNNGTKMARLSMATSEKWRDKTSGEMRERVEWHSIVIWSPMLAEMVERHVKKGTKLMIEGSLHTRKWTDQQGQERYSTEIELKGFMGQIWLHDTGSGKTGAPARGRARTAPAGDSGFDSVGSFDPATGEIDSDIPF